MSELSKAIEVSKEFLAFIDFETKGNLADRTHPTFTEREALRLVIEAAILAEQLKENIEDSLLVPLDNLPTEDEFTKQTGISIQVEEHIPPDTATEKGGKE